MSEDRIEDLTTLPWCRALLHDPSVTIINTRNVLKEDPSGANVNTFLNRTLWGDDRIRALVTLFRPGNGERRQGDPTKLDIQPDSAMWDVPPHKLEQEAQRQAKKEEKIFDVTDPNAPEAIFLVSVGDNVNGGPYRLHGGILSTLLDHCMGILCAFVYNSRAPPTVELTVKFKKAFKTPGVFALRSKIKREKGRFLETVGWIEDGEGNVYAEATAAYVISKVEAAKL